MFGHVFTNHIPSRTPDYFYFSILNPIGDKEIPNFNVICYFASQGPPIFIQKNGTIVVLLQDIIPDIVPLCNNEILGPSDGWYESVHDFCLRGTFRVDLIFCGAKDWESTPKI